MNLRWRQLEKRLWSRVAPYDERRRMRFWQRLAHYLNSAPDVSPTLLRGLSVAAFGGIVVLNADAIAGQPVTALTLVGLWAMTGVVLRSEVVWTMSLTQPDYRLLWILPLPLDAIFRLSMTRLLLGALWTLLEFLIIYSVLGASAPHPVVAWIGAAACAVVQTILSLALTLLIVTSRINPGMAMVGILAALGVTGLVSTNAQYASTWGKPLLMANPMGWMNAVYLNGWVVDQTGTGLATVLVTLVLATVPFSLGVLRRLHHRGAFRHLERQRGLLFRIANEQAPPQAQGGLDGPEQVRNDLPAWFLSGQSNRLNRFVSRFLTPRETRIAEAFLLTPHWWRDSLCGSVLYFGLFLVATVFIDMDAIVAFTAPGTAFPVDFRPEILVISLLASLVFFGMTLAKSLRLFLWTSWPESRPGSQTQTGAVYRSFRLLPVTYWDLAKVVAKVNTVFVILLLPLAVIFSLSPAFNLVVESTRLSSIAPVKALAIVWFCSLVLPSLPLTPTMRDGLRFWRSILAKVIVLLALYGLGMALIVGADRPWKEAGLVVVSVFAALAWFGYCGRQYCRGRAI